MEWVRSVSASDHLPNLLYIHFLPYYLNMGAMKPTSNCREVSQEKKKGGVQMGTLIN